MRIKVKSYLYTALSTLVLSGCAANTAGVSPSQNSNLQTVSPSGTAEAEGGAMQRALDKWLKEEWTPMTAAPSVETTTTTTTTTPDGKVVTTTKEVVAPPTDETSFTLQKYADKWKAYNEKQAKLNEGKPKEASNVEKLERMPIIGK